MTRERMSRLSIEFNVAGFSLSETVSILRRLCRTRPVDRSQLGAASQVKADGWLIPVSRRNRRDRDVAQQSALLAIRRGRSRTQRIPSRQALTYPKSVDNDAVLPRTPAPPRRGRCHAPR